MKKWLSGFLVLCVILLSCTAIAESYDEKSLEELQALRDGTANELMEINTAIGKKIKENELTGSSEEALGKIKDLFPDETLACYVRDELAKFSIEQTVTQQELDSITSVYFWATSAYPKDLTGIGYLRNITSCTVGNFNGLRLPDDMRNCVHLSSIDFLNSKLEAIPDWIGELTELTYFESNRGTIQSIPESIGNLTRLKTLVLENNDIQSVPATIANCVSLKTLNLKDNNISELPDAMWSMQLDKLVLSGNPIR